MADGVALVAVDPIHERIVYLLSSLPDGWSDVDSESLPELDEQALHVLSAAGLLRRRYRLKLTLTPTRGWLDWKAPEPDLRDYVVESVGHFDAQTLFSAIMRVDELPAGWWNALADRSAVRLEGTTHARRTAKGDEISGRLDRVGQ